MASAAMLLSAGEPLSGQLLFDWPLRGSHEPEALLTGAEATLWNPAGTALGTPEIWLLSAEGPRATDLTGLAVASTGRIPRVGAVGIAFRHLGIDDIPRTTDSPTPLPGDLDVAENLVALTVARRFGGSLSAGGGVSHVRATVVGPTRSRTTGEVGAVLRPQLPLRPSLAVAVREIGHEVRVLAGVGATVPGRFTGPFRARLGYGVDIRRAGDAVDHRGSVRVTWQGRFHAGAGFTVADPGEDVTPLWLLGADLGRYSLSVLREALASGFGAATFYRISIRFS